MAEMQQQDEAGARWDRVHASRAQTNTLARIRRDVYGADFFDDGAPNAFYYATMTDLRHIVDALGVGPGASVVDLGCGSGAPTVWVARETGASLVGIDLSEVGLEQARRRASAWQLEDRIHFLLADLRATGLEEGGFDGGMSLDALDTIPAADDRARAFAEAARLLKPGARFVHTNWESAVPGSLSQPPRDAVSDYRPMIRAAGFEVEAYQESAGWEARDREIFGRTIDAESDLRAELGDEAATTAVRMARVALDEISIRRRVWVIARRLAS